MSAEGVSVNCFGINLCHIDYSARKPFFCGSASLIQRLAYDRSQILSVSVLLSGDYNLKETVFKGFVFILLFRVLFLASCCVCNGTFLSFFSLPDNACNYFDHQGTGPCNEVDWEAN